MSDRYALVGNPVGHSKSPRIHTEFARATRQDLEYGLIEAPLDGFAHAVERFRTAGGRGLNVTLPFKEQAFTLCTQVSERARLAGVANTLVLDQGLGDNTDGIGLVRDLSDNLGIGLRNQSILLLGAGGAAQGVIGALLEAGARRLVIANRTAARAQALAARFAGVSAAGYEALVGERFDVVINATSAGLSDEAPSIPASVFGEKTVAYEMVYGRETPFMAAARRAGARVSDGLGMLVEQAAESFFLWRGVRPPTRPVLASLRGA
jgi:shikimate dehydrogenase